MRHWHETATSVLAAGVLAAGLLAAGGAAQANTLHFQMNPNFDGQGQRQLFLFGPANAQGTVTGASGFSASFDLGAEGFAVVDIPRTLELRANEVQNLGFRVDSSSAISGYFLSRNTATTDSTYLIDGNRLGTDHFVLGYQNIRPDQVSAQATEDNTTVTFTRPGGAQETVVLNAGQTFMIQASSQLTGTRVQSDKPIAVFSGNNCTNVPTGVTACDHIVEQMPPVDALSTRYLLAQTVRTGLLGNVVRVVATADGTEVRANGNLVATLDTGQFWEGRVAGGLELTATGKVLVGQYLIGQSQAGDNTDPAMTIVPGQDQWLSSYVFSPPLGTASFASDFIQIIIGTSDIATLLLDGVGVDSGLFRPLASTAFSFGNIDVSDKNGRFAISAASPFQILLMGFQSFDSYFTYGGAAFAPGASPPPEPPSGDVLFWDGDAPGNAANGRIDGGDGVLTATSTNLAVPDGSLNGALPGTPVTVVFAGAPGTVEVDDSLGAVVMGGMAFTVDGYRITGDPVTLSGTTATLCVGARCPIGGGGGGGGGGDGGGGEGEGEGDIVPEDAGFVARIEAPLSGTAGVTKTGDGTLLLGGAGSYAGPTRVAEGTLAGTSTSFGAAPMTIEAGATLVFDQETAGLFANPIAGAGTLVKQGTGRLVLAGDSPFSGETLVERGRLDVVGNLGQSPVRVGTGATLGGTGTVGTTRIGAGGTVAPGTSIGTITVNGDFVQASGSTFEVELNAAGQSDRIIATGTATVEPGATLSVVRLGAARLVLGTRYTVLSGEAGRTGSYATLRGDTLVSRFISVVQELDANNVFLGVRQTSAFASAGRTPNQIAAATGADNPGNGRLYTALAYLQTEAEAEAAFDAISGEIHASARGASVEDSRFVREATLGRLAGQEGRAVWMHAYGASGRFDGDGNAADVRRRLGGFFLGLDLVRDSNGFTAGLVTGAGGGSVQVRDRVSGAEVSDTHLGAYAGWARGGFALSAGVAQMWRKADTRRRAEFPGFADFLTARTDLELFQVFAEARHAFALGGTATVEPFGQLAWARVKTKGFAERGGPAALASPGGSDDHWITQLGGGVVAPVAAEGARLSASAAWRRVSGDDRRTPIGQNFAIGPMFTVLGAPLSRDAAALEAGLSGNIAPRAEVEISYSGTLGGGVFDHGGRASLRIRF
jgi:outer membrane autotransporter protein